MTCRANPFGLKTSAATLGSHGARLGDAFALPDLLNHTATGARRNRIGVHRPCSHYAALALDFDGILTIDWTDKPLYLPRKGEVPLIITGRSETLRVPSMTWLVRHGVRVRRLVMYTTHWRRPQPVLRRRLPRGSSSHIRHQADTIAWLAQQPASSLDWVYLDSDHGEPHVHRELCQAFRVVKAGGWICGHDYSAIFGGVVAAVDRFCVEHGQVIHVATDEDEVTIIASELERLPWLPRSAACNSVAIQVEK